VRITRAAGIVAAFLLLVAACGGDDDSSSTGREANGASAGKAAATDDDGATTSTTAKATTTTAGTSTNSSLASGPGYVTTEGPSGAGCTPGTSATDLPTGWWAGEIKAVQESSVDFDLVCFFSGDAATQAALEDGTEATDDYYVRNSNPRTFRVSFPSGATPATCAQTDAQPFACTVADVLQLYRSTEATATSVLDGHTLIPFPLVWVHTTDGAGDYLFMQYTP
jgi:hypothetical protein